MICPECDIAFHDREDEWESAAIDDEKNYGRSLVCLITSCPECKSPIVKLQRQVDSTGDVEMEQIIFPERSREVRVIGDIPGSLKEDFVEATQVLRISPKASAALSRRILQSILNDQGYPGRDLVRQVQAVLSETDPDKRLPLAARSIVDAVRNFGNFSAHEQKDTTTSEIIDVEPEEAGWCLQIISELFEHYYIRPAQDARKLEELNQKLKQAGKPPVK